MDDNFNIDLKVGKASEEKVISWLKRQYCVAKVSQTNFSKDKYDIKVVLTNGGILNIEVKAAKGGPWKYKGGNFRAETETGHLVKDADGDIVWETIKRPDYLTNHHKINFMVYYDIVAEELYFYDCSKFAAHVESRKDTANIIEANTAKCIFFRQEDKAAGFLKMFNLTDRNIWEIL